MKQKNNLPLFIGISVAFGIIIGSFFNIKNSGKIYNPSQQSIDNKLSAVLKYIETEYVDEVDIEEITEEIITNLLDKLDPHSSYLPKELQQASQERMDGNFVGIGVQFVVQKDSVVVVQVLPDGPSKKAGIRAGDRLLIADNDTLYNKNINSNDVVKKLKGEENTQVKVKVFRPGETNLIDFNITRGKVAIKSVPVYYKITDSLGYIKLDRFAATSYKEFKQALTELQKEGIKDLVFDLRGNPGGYMHIADQISDEFLEDGKLIVYTKNKKGRQTNSVATTKGSFEKGHVYVLVDQNSASASEIVSGALQDNDRATIIGRRTFGKGLVQQPIDFKDGSAMRLTTARYYTPTGRSIQKPYGINNNYNDEVTNRYISGELFYKDSIKVIDSLKYTTPKGKVVYGGGGITPDVFIPIDTVNIANFYELNMINNFVYQYIDTHRAALSIYNKDNFINEFKVTTQIKKEFQDYVSPLKFPNLDIDVLLKENIGASLIGDEVYYKLVSKRDPYIKRVLDLHKK